jgi:hypothetical protein
MVRLSFQQAKKRIMSYGFFVCGKATGCFSTGAGIVSSYEKIDEIITGAFGWIHATRSLFPLYTRIICVFNS